MKGRIKRFISLVLGFVLSLSLFTACGGNSGNKTILKIGVFNGGLGYQWAVTLESQFESLYEDVSFEPGKKGVDVQINPQKDLFKVDAIKSAIKNNSNPEDIYYTCYEFYKEFAKEGLVLNITDTVQEKVYLPNGELADMTYNPETKKYELNEGAQAPTMSIEDKMYDFFDDAFYMDNKMADFDNNGQADVSVGYYALPYETSISGFVYDHDLFEEYGWLTFSGKDGLPKTMDEFFELLDLIYGADMIAWTGHFSNYWQGWLSSFYAQYEGYDNAVLSYTYDGTYTFPQSSVDMIENDYPEFLDGLVDANNAIKNQDGTYTVTIKPENAWLLAYQPSKMELLKVLRDLTDPLYFNPALHNTGSTYDVIQRDYVWSKLAGMRIAMIQEGEWWENEARSYFNTTGGYGSRDFRFMPMPMIDGQALEDTHVFASANAGTHLVVNGKTKKAELCRLWLQFSHTESALETFTLANGAVRDAFKYDLSDTQLNQLTPFARNVYDIKTNTNDNIQVLRASPYANSHAFANNTPMGGIHDGFSTLLSGAYGSWDAIGGNEFSFFFNHAGDLEDNYVTVDEFLYGKDDYFISSSKTEARYGAIGPNGYYNKTKWENNYQTWFSNLTIK